MKKCQKSETNNDLSFKLWYNFFNAQIKIVARYAERVSVDSFFPQSYGTLKQRYILETIDFIGMAYGPKNVSL